MQKMILALLGVVLLFSFGCPGEEAAPIAEVPEEEVPEATGPIKCGSDFDCFIEASENCTPANVMHEVTLNMFGMLITTDTYMELQGMENETCVYYQETKEQTVEFSEDFKEMMRASNATEGEIQQAEDQANEEAQLVVGTEMTCRMDPAKLHEMFTNWKDGKFSTNDWAEADCKMTYPPALEEDVPLQPPEEEVPEEVIPEEPIEEIICVPVATAGYIELGVYEGDAKYYYEGTEVAYIENLEMGKYLSGPDGSKIILDDIIINGTCEECGAKPSWTYDQMAKLKITVPNGPDHTVIAYIGQPGSFISSYKCKTLDWDGKTCVEWVPDESHQYYVWKVVADKTCVEEGKEIGGEEA